MKPRLISFLLLTFFSTTAFAQTALLDRGQLGTPFISDEYLEWDHRYDAITLFADSLCKRLDRMWVTGLISEEKRDKEREVILALFQGERSTRNLTILTGNEDMLREAPLRRRLIIRRRNIFREIDKLETRALLSYGATAYLEKGLKEEEVWKSSNLFGWIPFESVEIGEEYPDDFEEATHEFIASIMPLLPDLKVEEVAITIDTIETTWRKGLGYTMTAVINGLEVGVQELFPYMFHRDSTIPDYQSLAKFTLPGVTLINTWLKESSSSHRLCSIQALQNNRPTGSRLIVLANEKTAALLSNYQLPGVLTVILPEVSAYGLRREREDAFRAMKRSGLLDRLSEDEFTTLKRQMTLFSVKQESDYFALASIYLLTPCQWNFHPEQISGDEIETYLDEVTLGSLIIENLEVKFDPETESGLLNILTATGSYRYEGSFNEIRCGESFAEFLRQMIAAEPVDLTPITIGPRRPQIFLSNQQIKKLARHFSQTFPEEASPSTY